MLQQILNNRILLCLITIFTILLLFCSCSSNNNDIDSITETVTEKTIGIDNDFQTIFNNATVDYPSSNDEWEYTVYTDTTGVYDKFVIITQYIGENSEVNVPKTIEGYDVISIRDLFKCEGYDLAELQIKITNIILPNTLLEIGRDALSASSLSFGGLGKGYDTYYNCDSIEKIVIPNSVQYIENFAFSGWQRLKEVTIPSTVKQIGDQSFDTYFSKNLVIYGEPSSTAAQYCSEQNIIFKSMV